MLEKSASILLVEDNDEDFEATRRAFRRCGCEIPLHRCDSGDEALSYLQQRSVTSHYNESGSAPCMILLDLNLPGTDGREVLKEIRRSENLRTIPVIIMTTSLAEEDIDYCYRAGANSYIQKPIGLDQLMHSVQTIIEYWCKVVTLPKAVME